MLIPGLTEKYRATEEELFAANAPVVGWGDFFSANVEEAFERTTTSIVLTEKRVLDSEAAAYGRQAPGFEERVESGNVGFDDFFAGEGKAPEYIAKDDWHAGNPLFRKGIAWREGMTAERARIYAEDYDEREARRVTLAAGQDQYGFLRGTVPGFFAGMLGSLPDPVNLLPFGGALARGGRVGAAALRGAVEGAVSNAAVDALVFADLKSRGEDLGFADFALDTAFGAALGGLFGGAGAWPGGRAERRTAGPGGRAGVERDLVAEWMDEYRAVTSDGHAGRYDDARRNIHGADRRTLLAAQESAVADLVAGRPVNVEAVDGIRETLGRVYDTVLRDPASLKREAPASPVRLATKGQNADGDTPAGHFDSTMPEGISGRQGRGLSEESIAGEAPEVNRFAVEAPEEFSPAPPLGEAARTAFEEHGIDAGGVSVEERLALEADRSGELAPEEAAALIEAREAAESLQRIEEEGYAMMDCVWRANDV
jgi:hypothetical protein